MNFKDIVIPNSNNSPDSGWKYINYIDTGSCTKNEITYIQKIEKGFYPSRAKRVVKKNDIIISTVRPNQCHYAIIKEPVENMVVSTGFTVLTSKENVIPEYLYFFLSQEKITKRLSVLAEGATTSYPSITPDDILELEIDLPDIDYQKKIVEFLWPIEEKIALNKKINTELENLAQTIYNYWFVQFDFPNEEGKPYKTSGGEMVWNEELKREIPKGWEVFLLKEKLEFERGVEPGSDKYFEKQIDETLIPFFKVGGMNGDTDVWIKNDEANGAICREEDILLSLDGSVGRIAIGLSGAYSSGIRKVYPKNGNFPKSYIYFLLHSNEIQQTIKKNATGSNILHAAKALDYMMAPYNANVVESFDKLCNPIFNKILATKRENQELIKLRDFLLPLLMNGQVKVKSEATEQLSMAAEPQVKYGK